MEKTNFFLSAAVIILIIFSFLIYTFSPKKDINPKDEERLQKYSKEISMLRKIYSFVGQWLLWISSLLIDIFPKGINPNKISFFGLILSLSGAIAVALDFLALGAVFVILGGIMDLADGKIARKTNSVSKAGALFDSVIDRIGEISIFSSICVLLLKYEYKVSVVITILAMGFSLLVSYVRARGESLGVLSEEGIMRRPERIFIISITLLLDSLFMYLTEKIIFLHIGVFVIFLGAFYTSLERFKAIYSELKNR